MMNPRTSRKGVTTVLNAENKSTIPEPRLQIIEEISQDLKEIPFWMVEIVQTFVKGLNKRTKN